MSPNPPNHKVILQQNLLTHATRFEHLLFKYRRWLALASFVIVFVVAVLVGNYFAQLQQARKWPISPMQKAHDIGRAMALYASDHKNLYPDGKSSTEIFQQLVDQGYVGDVTLFYLKMPGKTVATTKRLKPENVCWDVTAGASPDSSPTLPVLFSSGCKVEYVPNGKARALSDDAPFGFDGIVTHHVDNGTYFVTPKTDGIPFLPADFDPKGKTYHQLTPDGRLQL